MTSNSYLLDSNVLYWLGFDSRRLGKETLRLIRTKHLYFSSISLAELSEKARSGRIKFYKDPAAQWQEFGIQPLSFFLEAASHFSSFSAHEISDPFDRMIMATARANNLKLITSDRRILAQGFDWVLDATT
jgi:PIN domain nuclease of toxin-antitoxin system